MYFSIVISVLLVVSLVIYFVMSRKLRTPTVTTEVLVKKYNSRLSKLDRFLRRNKIEFNLQPYLSSVQKQQLTWENIVLNLKAIKAIEKNNELIEEIFIASSKDEAREKLKTFNSNCTLFEFAGELEADEKLTQVFEIIGYEKTKLDFEMQRYFGSQAFYKLDDSLIFVKNDKALQVNPKNVFDSQIEAFSLKTQLKTKKTKENPPIYTILMKIGEREKQIDLSVPQENVEKILKKFEQKNSD